jgi:hypothetical protein
MLTTTFPSEKVIDLSAQYADIEDMVAEAGITRDDIWLGLQFVGNDEVPISLAQGPTVGLYRETGMIYIHVVDLAKLGVGDAILTRAEAIRNLLRGTRIDGQIKIESVSPPNFGVGATLSFEGGYISATFMAAYERDLNL